MNAYDKAVKAANLADNKLAEDIEVFDVSDLTSMTEFFVICSAGSENQMKAISDEIEENFKESGITPLHIEGYRSSTWVLYDYGDVIVHIFHKESRMFYSLERLWSDAKKVDFKKEE